MRQNKLTEPTPDECFVYLSDPIRDVIGAETGRIVMCKVFTLEISQLYAMC